ncbi:MAG: nitroreductase family deazaflavin-dependent oxidoreductase [Candidatus Limnocylindrales bacterium]
MSAVPHGAVAESDIGDLLARRGTVAIVATTGRMSGRPTRAAVGYLLQPDGSIVVAAGDPDADWARNLEADPRCVVTVADRSWPCVAAPLGGEVVAAALRDLILRYGTPAERLGSGPVFRLVPTSGSPGTALDGR